MRRQISELLRAELDWPLFLDLARRHGVEALIVKTLESDFPNIAGQEWFVTLQHRVKEGAAKTEDVEMELAEICGLFERKGIPALPISGAGLSKVAYGHAGMRDSDDLTFVVPLERLTDAETALTERGYRQDEPSAVQETSPRKRSCWFVKQGVSARVCVNWGAEHRRFMALLSKANIWNHRLSFAAAGKQIGGCTIEELILLIAIDGTRQGWTKLRTIVEIGQLTRRYQINWKGLFVTASEWKCQRVLFLGLALAQQVAGMMLPPDIQRTLEKDRVVSNLASYLESVLFSRGEDLAVGVPGPVMIGLLQDTWYPRWSETTRVLSATPALLQRLPFWVRQHLPPTGIVGLLQSLQWAWLSVQSDAEKCPMVDPGKSR
jgi:hypothetical protein